MGLGVQIDVYAERMTDTQLGIFCLMGVFATLCIGYLLTALVKNICRIKNKLLRAMIYYITIALLLLDPLYLSFFCSFFGGGDMNGIALICPEWTANKSESSKKAQLRKDINQIIRIVSTYSEFLAFMEAKGYEIKNAEFGENSRKYITFRSPDMSRPVRGSAKSLGKNFTKERIKERIENKRQKAIFPSVHNKLIDTNAPNIAGNIGLQKWANKENLKIVSAEYNKMLTHNLHNFSELEDRIALLHMQQKEVNTSVVSLESQIHHLREMLKYAEQYQKNKIYDDHYKSSKDPDRYFRKYESQIILFAGAEHILQENGIDLKQLNTNKLQAQISELISRKKSINTQYVSFRKEMKELELIHQNLSKYLKPDDPEIEKSSHNKLPSL